MPRAGDPITSSIRLVRELGSGGMGSVWIADHRTLRTQVVVKFMHARLAGDKESLRRFSREAAAGANVKSPHVVQVHDHGVAPDGTPFIVMELLEGSDLAAYCKRNGPMPLLEVEHVIAQTCKALFRAHERGIIHRDIKPQNIFLTNAGGGEVFVKVLDFGIAKASESNHAVSSATKTGAVMGSPSYMSPEQMVGAKGIDRRTDLWALGVVAFECLTGQLPFEAETIGGLAIAVCSGPMPVPSRINPALSEEVDQWFARSCAREPTQRFHSAKDMAEALHLLATGQRSSDPRFSRDPRATSSSPVASTELAGPLSPPPAMVPTLSSALPAKTTPALGATTGAPLSAGSEEEVLLPMQRGKGTVVAMAAVVLLAAVTAVGVVLANHSPAVPSAASAEGSAAPAPSVPPGSGFSAGPAAAAPAKSESATPASDPLPSPRSVPGPSTTPGVPNAEKASVAGLPTPTTVRSASPAATMRSPTLPPAAAPPVRDLAPPPAPVTNCNPPTWTDESGHVHLKRGCQ